MMSRQLLMVAGHKRGIADRRERFAHVAQRLRIVVDHEDARRLAGTSGVLRVVPEWLAGGLTCLAGFANLAGLAIHVGQRDRERNARALADAPALGPDASSVGLDQSPADGKTEPRSRGGPGLLVAALESGILLKQVWKPVCRDPRPFVTDRDGHKYPVLHGGDPNGRGLRGVPDGVGEQVVQYLFDALPVGHDPRQVAWHVDQHGMLATATLERGPRPVHQVGHFGGLGRHRQRARVDAAGVPAGR